MKFLLTGTTSGIGASLHAHLLDKGHQVVALNRKKTFLHSTVDLIIPDLACCDELSSVLEGHRSLLAGVDICILNAGTLGTIDGASRVSRKSLIDALSVNSFSAKAIIDSVLSSSSCTTFVYISSGASVKGYTGWLEYCCTKAFTDAMLRVYAVEHVDKIFVSISPGATSTPMQEKVRTADPGKFSSMNKFHELYLSGSLRSPDSSASAIIDCALSLTLQDSGSFIRV